MLPRASATRTYLLLSGVSGLFYALVFTVSSIYQFKTAGLGPLELVLVGTTLEATAFLSEVPTGIVADVYSRRLSIVLGFLLVGAGFVLEGLLPRFTAILLAQVLWGVGITFTSGATEAWITDEVGEAAAAPLFLRAAQAYQTGMVLGTVVSVLLASARLSLPIVVGGAAFIGLALVLAAVMPEQGFRPVPRQDRDSWQQLTRTLQVGLGVVRASPTLLTILAIVIFRGASSEAFDRLWQAHFVRNFAFPAIGQFDPIVWFGIIIAIARLLTIGATEIVRRRLDTATHRGAAGALFVINAAVLVATLVVGLTGSFGLAVAAYLVVTLSRNTSYPIYTAWINQRLEPRVRATVHSLTNQVDALGQIAGGPALGVVGTVFSIRAAIAAAGVVLLPVLPLIGRTFNRDGDEAVVLAVDLSTDSRD